MRGSIFSVRHSANYLNIYKINIFRPPLRGFGGLLSYGDKKVTKETLPNDLSFYIPYKMIPSRLAILRARSTHTDIVLKCWLKHTLA